MVIQRGAFQEAFNSIIKFKYVQSHQKNTFSKTFFFFRK